MRKTLSLLIIILATINTDAQTNVVPWSSDRTIPQNYISYFLPQSEIIIEIEVKKHICKAGRFANYAKRFLALDNIITTDSSFFEISKITLYEQQVPDSSKQYAVEINLKSTAYKISKDKQDIIMGINIDNPYYPTVDKPELQMADTIIVFDYSLLNKDAINATTEEKMAEVTAKQILNIRESHTDLLTGDHEHNYNENSLKYMLEKLENTEKKLTELFTGKNTIYTETNTIRIIPKKNIENAILFRFSSVFGIVESDNYAGYPVYITVEATDIPPFTVTNTIKSPKKFGIFYNVAGKAKITLYDIKGLLEEKILIMPQFGHTSFLPASLFNKPNTSVLFTPYGTIKTIK